MAMINQNFRGAIANPSRFGGLQKIDNSKVAGVDIQRRPPKEWSMDELCEDPDKAGNVKPGNTISGKKVIEVIYTEESVCIRVETTELTGGLIEIDW